MFAWKLFSKWSHWKFSTMCCSFNEPQFALLTLSLQTWDDAWCPWLKEMVYCNSMHTCHNHWSHKLHQNTSCTCNNTQLDSWSKLFNLTHMWIHREWVGQFSDLLSCAITWKAHGLIYLEYGLWVFLFESTRNILSPVHSSTAFPESWDFSALNWRLWASIELQQNSQGLCKITKNAKVIPNDQGCSK